MKRLTAIIRHAITNLKPAQAVQNRTPAATPSPPQQLAANTTQSSLVGMSKEEKAAEMNRRKEERKQVSRLSSPRPFLRLTTPLQRIAQLKAQKASGGKA